LCSQYIALSENIKVSARIYRIPIRILDFPIVGKFLFELGSSELSAFWQAFLTTPFQWQLDIEHFFRKERDGQRICGGEDFVA